MLQHNCDAACKSIVSVDHARCFSLHHLQFSDVFLCEGIPDNTGILHDSTNGGRVTKLFRLLGALLQVPLEKCSGVVCLFGYGVDMGIPTEIILESYS